MRVVPEKRISRIETGPGATSIVIPGRPTLAAIFLLLWVSFWTFGGIVAIRSFVESVRRGHPIWFLALWLIGWIVGEVVVGGTLAYMFTGREVVTVRSGELEIRLEILGLQLSWEYDVPQIRGLRVDASKGRNRFPTGLAFDYGAKTVRFGRGIDEAEAAIILKDLKATGMLSTTF